MHEIKFHSVSIRDESCQQTVRLEEAKVAMAVGWSVCCFCLLCWSRDILGSSKLNPWCPATHSQSSFSAPILVLKLRENSQIIFCSHEFYQFVIIKSKVRILKVFFLIKFYFNILYIVN